MQNSTDSSSQGRPIILYIIIAVALFAALVLTVRWAKSRADYYGQQQTNQGQQVAGQESQPQGAPAEPEVATTEPQSQSQPQPQQEQQPQSTSAPATSSTAPQSSALAPSAVANTGPPASAHVVPSTGPEQFLLPIISLSAVVFAGLSYLRTRRRFRDQALAQ